MTTVLVQILGRVFYRSFVFYMLLIMWDMMYVYFLPLAIIVGFLTEFHNISVITRKDKKEILT